MEVKYPNITVRLVGEDGNSMAIVITVKNALRKNGIPEEEISKFQAEALSGDRDHLLQTCMAWVEVE